MRFQHTAIRLFSIFAAAALLSTHATALTDGWQQGYTKTLTASLSDGTVYVGTDYVIADSDDKALTFQGGMPKAEDALAEPDARFFQLADAEGYLTWQICAATDGDGCTLRPANDKTLYLSYDGKAFSLSDNAADGLVVSFRFMEGNSGDMTAYCPARKQYLCWQDGSLTLSETPTALRMYRVSGTKKARFYYWEGENLSQYATAVSWEGDTLTLPALPEKAYATPVGWNQVDPDNTATVLASYEAGMETEPMTDAAFFVAAYDYDAAKVTLLGSGNPQTIDSQVGKKLAAQLDGEAPDTFLLYDSKGNSTRLTKNSQNQLVFSVTEPHMYLCACDTFAEDDTAYLRITTVDDFVGYRNIINNSETAGDYAFSLVNDLDLQSLCSLTTQDWVPIAPSRNGKYGAKSVVFRGNDHLLQHLYMCNTKDEQGFFGYVGSFTCKDLTINGVVQGEHVIGGFCAEADTLNIDHCGCYLNVSGKTYVGGFCGKVNTSADFHGCCSVRGVTAKEGYGGMFYGYAKSVQAFNGFTYGRIIGGENALGNTPSCKDLLADNIWTTDDSTGSYYDLNSADASDFTNGIVLEALNADGDIHWAQGADYPVFALGTYNLFVEYDKEGGSLSIPKTIYQAGETVSFMVSSADGYRIQLRAESASGKIMIPIVAAEDNYYCFAMPADDVNLQIRFVKNTTLRGDVDCSGTVDVTDAVLLARLVVGDRTVRVSEEGLANAEVDGKNGISDNDLVTLLRILAKKIS